MAPKVATLCPAGPSHPASVAALASTSHHQSWVTSAAPPLSPDVTVTSPDPGWAASSRSALHGGYLPKKKKNMNFQKSRGGGNAKSIFISKTALSEHDAYNLKHRIPTASEGCSSNEGRWLEGDLGGGTMWNPEHRHWMTLVGLQYLCIWSILVMAKQKQRVDARPPVEDMGWPPSGTELVHRQSMCRWT